MTEQDKEAENLVQWFLLSSRIKENNAEIRELMKNYKETGLQAREGVKEALNVIKIFADVEMNYITNRTI